MAQLWTTKILSGNIRALVGGQGPSLVLLPGWPETAEAWTEVFPLLCQKYQTIAIDPPGLGGSAPSNDGYDTKTVSSLLQDSLQSLTNEPFHLVGHDVGAWIAYSWASQYPESIRSLTLLDSGIPGLTPPLSYPLPAELNIKMWQFSFNLLPELPEILTQGREGLLLDWLFDRKAVHPEKITPERRRLYVDAYSKPGGMSRGFEYYRAGPQSAVQNKAFSENMLQMPVLAVGGQTGVGDNLLKAARQVAVNVRGGVIDDCGHYVMEEAPDAVAGKLLEFLGDVDGQVE